jgi:hypothetical protein
MTHTRWCSNCGRSTKHVYVNSDKTLDICMEEKEKIRKGEKLYNYLEEEAKEYLISKGIDFLKAYDSDIIYREIIHNLRWKLEDEELEKILE